MLLKGLANPLQVGGKILSFEASSLSLPLLRALLLSENPLQQAFLLPQGDGTHLQVPCEENAGPPIVSVRQTPRVASDRHVVILQSHLERCPGSMPIQGLIESPSRTLRVRNPEFRQKGESLPVVRNRRLLRPDRRPNQKEEENEKTHVEGAGSFPYLGDNPEAIMLERSCPSINMPNWPHSDPPTLAQTTQFILNNRRS